MQYSKAIGKSVFIASLLFVNSSCKSQSPADSDAKVKEPSIQDVDLAKLPSDPTKNFVNLVTVKINPKQLSNFLHDLKEKTLNLICSKLDRIPSSFKIIERMLP